MNVITESTSTKPYNLHMWSCRHNSHCLARCVRDVKRDTFVRSNDNVSGQLPVFYYRLKTSVKLWLILFHHRPSDAYAHRLHYHTSHSSIVLMIIHLDWDDFFFVTDLPVKSSNTEFYSCLKATRYTYLPHHHCPDNCYSSHPTHTLDHYTQRHTLTFIRQTHN